MQLMHIMMVFQVMLVIRKENGKKQITFTFFEFIHQLGGGVEFAGNENTNGGSFCVVHADHEDYADHTAHDPKPF